MSSTPSVAPELAALAEALRDRYLIERELGRGGMALVYLARDLRHERPVALKVILPVASGDGADRFDREIRVTAGLQHPNILPVFDSGRTAGRPWYTMPYVAGETLRRRLERDGMLPIAEAVRLAREVADALAYAHALGVVHRDVKPENILLSAGHALVADFGVARVLGPRHGAITGEGTTVGSPAYMSPEQAAGEPTDGRTDVYALGCVLFEMLTGRPPFTGSSAMALMARRLVESAPEVRALRPDVPPWLERSLRSALAREVAERFHTATAFAEALIEPSTATGLPTVPVVSAAAPPERPSALVERDEFLDTLERLVVAAVAGNGTTVVVTGEAGIGKTSLVEAFARSQRGVRLLWGWCEALFTPRALGPLYDIAAQLGGPLEEVLRNASSRETIFATLLDELGPGRRPTVLVLEDVHWADEATLDLLKFLGRRAPRLPLLVLVTSRDDEIGGRHPLRAILADLPRGVVRRLELQPLSEVAVAALAQRAGRSGSGLHAATGGNPFYVSEVLAASQPGIPATVRDAVLSRAARASAAAREACEVVSVVPGKTEPWLLDALLGRDAPGVEECLAARMLTSDPLGVSFRHELARRAVEESLGPSRRRALHARVLAALEAAPVPVAPARLVHHAEGAGDSASVLRLVPLAAAQASALGAHREAAAHYEAALRLAHDLAPERRAELLEGRSYEEYLIERVPRAIAAREEAVGIWRRLGDRRREGAALRWLSRLHWANGARREAERYGAEAVAVLEPLGPGPELAIAYSNLAQLHMLAFERAGAETWGTRAIALAEQLGNREILIHALTNVGTSDLGLLSTEPAGGRLEQALALAHEAGYQEHIARCYACLMPSDVTAWKHERAERWLREGLAYTEARDLDFWANYLRSWRIQLRLDQGRWSEAERESEELLGQMGVTPVSRINVLAVLARIRARRGEPGVAELLDEARTLAERTEELQRLAPVALAAAEAAWLDGDAGATAAAARAAYELSLIKDNEWLRGALAVWMHSAGALASAPPKIPPSCALELSGNAVGAAEEWARLGCPYERALALAGAGTAAAREEAKRVFERLGARYAVRM
ncbi:MAG: protein kinase domain-containing protein [Gemmatimonadales bacterium]